MGIYRRKETGIYYLKIKEGDRYKRISLETKNKYIAQELYNSYLLDKVKLKISKNRENGIREHISSSDSCNDNILL